MRIKASEKPIEWAAEQNAHDKRTLEIFKDRDAIAREEFQAGRVGQNVPDLLNGTWLNTSAKSLTDFRGQYVLLDFWFIGCGPCEREFPSLKSLQKICGPKGFTIVSVHSGYYQSLENVRQFAERHQMNYPIVVDGPELEITKQFKPLGLHGYPHYILLDPEGKILSNEAFLSSRSLWAEKFEIIREHLWRSGNLR